MRVSYFNSNTSCISNKNYQKSCNSAGKNSSSHIKKEKIMETHASFDHWAKQKADLERFWKVLFPEYKINWNDFILPEYSERYSHLNIVLAGFTAEEIYAAIKNCKAFKFKKRSKYMGNIDKALKDAKAVQSRPAGNYAFADGGTDEPDQEHLNKSYDDSINAGLMFMGPIEYLLSCAFKEFLTGKPYDVKGVTRLSVLDSGGNAMCGSWYDGYGSRLGWDNRDDRNPDYGPRVVVFSTT
jgi:hypothetical protein